MSYLCDGPALDHEGFVIQVFWSYDHDASPDDSDCYDAEDLARFASGTSYFAQYEVQASFDGIVLGTAYIGGCDGGEWPTAANASNWIDPANLATGSIADYLPDLVAEAVGDAKERVKALTEKWKDAA